MSLLSRSAFAVLAALAVLSAASAGVNTPQSGWYSGNPLLGPNALRDLACGGPTCYAAGDFGTLLKSNDSGATWKGIVTGLTFDLRRVGLAGGSPDNVLVAGDCALRRSNDGGDTFVRLPITARDQGCASPIVAFSFPTADVGYVLLAQGRVLATADGGRSFSRKTSVPSTINDLLCTSSETCYAAGAALFRTDDGAASWTQVGDVPFALNRLTTADLTLYAVGQANGVAKSTDGGHTWNWGHLQGVTTRELTDVACGDASHCLMTTRDNPALFGPVYRTEDGGATATAVTPSADPTFTLSFTNGSKAIAAGALGSAEVSNDAGTTWATVGTRIPGTLGVLAASSATVAYAGGGEGLLVRTDDSGQSWNRMSPPTESAVMSIAGAGAERVYVLATDGSLQRSDNGGASYSLLNPGAERPVAIASISPDRLLLLGTGIAVSDNGGDTFEHVSGPAASARVQAGDLASGAVFAYGPTVIVASTDQGVTWRRVSKPRRRVIEDVDFVSRATGYLLDSHGDLWKTTSGGRRWTQLPTLGKPGQTLEFSSALEGYVAVRGFGSLRNAGVVLRTTDGGRSWHPQLVSFFDLGALESGGPVQYALGSGSSLFATDVGGDVGSASRLSITARPRSLRRPGRVLVGGRLSPADGGEQIVVSQLSGGRWSQRLATTAANGTFLTRWRLRRGAVYVAQVLGDADHRGAGTTALTVRVGTSR